MAAPHGVCRRRVRFGNRIEAGAAPGMATKQAHHGQPHAFDGAEARQCLHRIVRTAWMEPATRHQERRYRELIEAHERAQHGGGNSCHCGYGHDSARLPDGPSAIFAGAECAQCSGEIRKQIGEVAAQGLAPGDEHIVVPALGALRKNIGRSRTQAAARPVALDRIAHFSGDGEADPGIVMELIGCAAVSGLEGDLEDEARPDAFSGARRHSQEVGARLQAGKPHGRLGRKAFAALGAAARQHPPSADAIHALAKAMPALADQLARLVGALHERDSVVGRRTDAAACIRAQAPGVNVRRPIAGRSFGPLRAENKAFSGLTAG